MIRELVHVCINARKEAGLNMTQVAAAAGKDQSQISRFENERLGWPRDADAYLEGYVAACNLDGPHVLWERALQRMNEDYIVRDVTDVSSRVTKLDEAQSNFRDQVLDGIDKVREEMGNLTQGVATVLLQSRGDHLFDALLVHYIFTHAPIGLAFINDEFRFMRVNDKLADMNGKAVAEHIHAHVNEVLPELWPELQPLLERALAGEKVENVEFGIAPPFVERQRVWRATLLPVQQGVTGVLCIIEEITRQRLLEQLVLDQGA